MINAYTDLGVEDEAGDSLNTENVEGALANLQEDDHKEITELAAA